MKKEYRSQKMNVDNVLTPFHKYLRNPSRYQIHNSKSKTIQGFIGNPVRGISGHSYYAPLLKKVESRNSSKPRKIKQFLFNTLSYVSDKEMKIKMSSIGLLYFLIRKWGSTSKWGAEFLNYGS